MTYRRERCLIWLAREDGPVFRGAEIADALTSTSLQRRRMGVELLFELASAERARLASAKWCADQQLYNDLAHVWRHEEKLLLEAERMQVQAQARRVA